MCLDARNLSLVFLTDQSSTLPTELTRLAKILKFVGSRLSYTVDTVLSVLTCINHLLVLKTIFWSSFEWPLNTGLTVANNKGAGQIGLIC